MISQKSKIMVLIIATVLILIGIVFLMIKSQSNFRKNVFNDECMGLKELQGGPIKVKNQLAAVFNQKLTQNDIVYFQDKYYNLISLKNYSDWDSFSIAAIQFSKGTDAEWICRLKKESIIKNIKPDYQMFPQTTD